MLFYFVLSKRNKIFKKIIKLEISVWSEVGDQDVLTNEITTPPKDILSEFIIVIHIISILVIIWLQSFPMICLKITNNFEQRGKGRYFRLMIQFTGGLVIHYLITWRVTHHLFSMVTLSGTFV